MSEGWQAFELSYLLLPLLGGIGVAAITGPLGAFVVWRRLAYFGDALAHSGLLGITLALVFSFNITVGVTLVAICVALTLLNLQTRLKVPSDTLIGLISYTTLALGLLILGKVERIRVDVLGFLYGDILTLTMADLGLIYLGGLVVLGLLACVWQSLLRITVDPELAQVEGVRVYGVQTLYLLLLAVVIAVAIKIVGVLLITALLIIPAITARHLSKTPEQMAGLASLFGIIAVVIGIFASHVWDIPTGPAIVVGAVGLLLIANICKLNNLS